MSVKLSELNVGQSANIIKISCDDALRNRFYSFGVVKGARVFIDQITLAKNTMEIKINQTKIALRYSEAEQIEVEL